MEDLLVRLLSVLALDRFGDFMSETVVCPDRECGPGDGGRVVLGGGSSSIVISVASLD